MAAKGGKAKAIKDLGSGMNYRKKGLNRLLALILRRKMRRLVITHKDRLLRFGAELMFTRCDIQGIEIVIIHPFDEAQEGSNPVLRKSSPKKFWRSSRYFQPASMEADRENTRRQ